MQLTSFEHTTLELLNANLYLLIPPYVSTWAASPYNVLTLLIHLYHNSLRNEWHLLCKVVAEKDSCITIQYQNYQNIRTGVLANSICEGQAIQIQKKDIKQLTYCAIYHSSIQRNHVISQLEKTGNKKRKQVSQLTQKMAIGPQIMTPLKKVSCKQKSPIVSLLDNFLIKKEKTCNKQEITNIKFQVENENSSKVVLNSKSPQNCETQKQVQTLIKSKNQISDQIANKQEKSNSIISMELASEDFECQKGDTLRTSLDENRPSLSLQIHDQLKGRHGKSKLNKPKNFNQLQKQSTFMKGWINNSKQT